ncbi:uncharacterized protein LOC134958588 [Pseudophryne corroboree]|uniref:uncharacterized protein LOC134958588 n=1 Tax=Pseudophryne corroboree TaxID=495146 RepID=UPI003081FE50
MVIEGSRAAHAIISSRHGAHSAAGVSSGLRGVGARGRVESDGGAGSDGRAQEESQDWWGPGHWRSEALPVPHLADLDASGPRVAPVGRRAVRRAPTLAREPAGDNAVCRGGLRPFWNTGVGPGHGGGSVGAAGQGRAPGVANSSGAPAAVGGSGTQAVSAAQRVARACRELGAAAAQLDHRSGRDEQGRVAATPAPPGVLGIHSDCWLGPLLCFLLQERGDGGTSESKDEEVGFAPPEDFVSEKSTASGEVVQSVSGSSTRSSSRSSSSSSSSSSLSPQASEVSSTTRAMKGATKFAKRAAGQQERRKGRKRLSEDSRWAKKRRDLPGVVPLRLHCSNAGAEGQLP